MHRWFLVTASLIGALSVAMGAFAAHGLKQIAAVDTVAMFETGVRYQFYHTFALLAVAVLYEKYPGSLLQWAGNCFQFGIILFCGSLYILTALKVADSSKGQLAIAIFTPFGGLFFIAGWILMVISFIKKGTVNE
ncbi:MAG: DUF423 domain-containing protein [Chitinophagaceae bacterium]